MSIVSIKNIEIVADTADHDDGESYVGQSGYASSDSSLNRCGAGGLWLYSVVADLFYSRTRSQSAPNEHADGRCVWYIWCAGCFVDWKDV